VDDHLHVSLDYLVARLCSDQEKQGRERVVSKPMQIFWACSSELPAVLTVLRPASQEPSIAAPYAELLSLPPAKGWHDGCPPFLEGSYYTLFLHDWFPYSD